MKYPARILTLLFPALIFTNSIAAQGTELAYKKITLENGLDVIVHEDHSDPVVSVYVSYHVGSGREEPGRSGFAHLFEHMLFQGSQNVGDDQHFKLISEAGGTLNGTTNLDRTLYFETVPANQLELALWLEADRMGFVLPAVTLKKLDNQRDVVKNERRQNYENRPYAQSGVALVAALYPPDHPYSWVTIGSQEDLTAASLDDVHNFFRRWYGPNNATLAIGGDVKAEEVFVLVKKYFGTIPRGPEVTKPTPRPAPLEQTKRIVTEDKVQLPQIVLAWPAVEQSHADDAALTLLASILADGKTSILEKSFRIDEQVARNVSANNESAEVAGHFTIRVTAAPKVSLDDVELRVDNILKGIVANGVNADQLKRIKTRIESRNVRRLETVANKTSSLCVENMFTGNPNHAAEELKKSLAVTPDEIISVLKRYLLNKPRVVMSIVPEGKLQLAASGRTDGQLAQEKELDRTKKPAPGQRPMIQPPVVWHDKWDNGVNVTGTKYTEVPLTTLAIAVPAGRIYDSLDKAGLSSLTASCMNEGTKALNTLEFTEAAEALGANISVSADEDDFIFTLSVLNKNLKPALELLKDVILTPRFDESDFRRIKKQRMLAIETRSEDITGIASTVWQRLMFGNDSVLGMPANGTKATVEKLTIEDVKNYYSKNVSPAGARLTYAGDLDGAGVKELFQQLTSAWRGADRSAAKSAADASAKVKNTQKNVLYLVDKPGAAQSQIRIGHAGVAMSDPNYFPLTVLNYILGGAFSSRINMNLREDKGYTYGARSAFDSGVRDGVFVASGGIHTKHTKVAIVEFIKELKTIANGVTEAELAFAKNALAQNFALQYESSNARLGMVNNISKYGFKDDYPSRRIAELEKLTVADLKALAEKYIRAGEMQILVVGDKKEVGQGLSELGMGDVTELDIDGEKK